MIKGERVRIEFMRVTGPMDLPACTAPNAFRRQFVTALPEGRVGPLIRNERMGHGATGEHSTGYGLAMTAVYTRTRPQTRRQQLEEALEGTSSHHHCRSLAEEKKDK